MIPIHQTAKDFAVTAVKLGKRLQTQEREINNLFEVPLQLALIFMRLEVQNL